MSERADHESHSGFERGFSALKRLAAEHVDQLLPPERVLAADIGVTRHLLRELLSALEASGELEREAGGRRRFRKPDAVGQMAHLLAGEILSGRTAAEDFFADRLRTAQIALRCAMISAQELSAQLAQAQAPEGVYLPDHLLTLIAAASADTMLMHSVRLGALVTKTLGRGVDLPDQTRSDGDFCTILAALVRQREPEAAAMALNARYHDRHRAILAALRRQRGEAPAQQPARVFTL